MACMLLMYALRRAPSVRPGAEQRMKRNILVVERNPDLCGMFKSAFLTAGYDVQATQKTDEAFELVSSRSRSGRPYDLAVVDISDDVSRRFAADVMSINDRLPVFMLKDPADKTLVIELLNGKRVELIERFIEAYEDASSGYRPEKPKSGEENRAR